MIPYTDLLYFGLLVVPSVAAIALGLVGRMSRKWLLGINLVMLVVQYTDLDEISSRYAFESLWVVAAYGILQWTVAQGFLWFRQRRNDKTIFRVAIVVVLLPLAVVKFIPADWTRSYVTFLGISYVTFRSLDVVICIQDRLILTLSPGLYFTFLFFFPTISSGPIDRYNRFAKDFVRDRTRAELIEDLDGAVQRIFRGLLYKFILAALINEYWLVPLTKQTDVASTVFYMYAYTGYLFFDFAGYSAFAIAISYVLGIRTPENFNLPFRATNIVDFWNRWHISLSTWFRDHIYMRFIMAAMRGRWFRSKTVASCAAFYVSFGLMGIWHGTEFHYLIYGLYHGTLLSAFTIASSDHIGLPAKCAGVFWDLVRIVFTFHIVAFGLLIFSGRLG